MEQLKPAYAWRWFKLLLAEINRYKTTGVAGVFSTKEVVPAIRLGEEIRNQDPKPAKALDIGCGALACPWYMKSTITDVEWWGIDPIEESISPRVFNFKHAIAEQLPFPAGEFDTVVFASTFDHLMHPWAALDEAVRVLAPGGWLYIWYSDRPSCVTSFTADSYNKLHHWGFNRDFISSMVNNRYSFWVDAEDKQLENRERLFKVRRV